jgi:hypothetical protein
MTPTLSSLTISAGALVLAAASLILPGRLGAAEGGKSALARAAARESRDRHTPATPGLLTYVFTLDQQFGAVDLRSGEFLPIGPGLPPDVGGGIVPGPGKAMLTLSFSGSLESLDPATSALSVVGPTGLTDCSTPSSPCGPDSANALGIVDGQTYATDFANNLYSVNTTTGAAKLIGPTGMPGITFIPLTENSDGTLNVYDESLFSIRGKLYANFGTSKFNPLTGVATPVIPDALYQINPATGRATLVAYTEVGLAAIVNVNDTIYAFSAPTGEVVTLNLRNGKTQAVSDLDPTAGLVTASFAVQPDTQSAH